MRHVKRVPPELAMMLVVLVGLASTLVGIYLLAGAALALVAGGLSAIVIGLVADF